jgi:hypothetical protein
MSYPVYTDKQGENHTLKLWFALKNFYGEFYGFEKVNANVWSGWFMSHRSPDHDEWGTFDLREAGPVMVKGSLTVKPDDLRKLMIPVGFKRTG